MSGSTRPPQAIYRRQRPKIYQDSRSSKSLIPCSAISTTPFGGFGLSNAVLLLGAGSLADALTLARPALEYMLDITYLRLYPEEVEFYESKADAHNLRIGESGPAARDPRHNMRFMRPAPMNKKIRNHPDCTEVHREMVNCYNLVSSVAEHTSPERKTLGLGRLRDWDNVIGLLENVTFFAFHTLDTFDGGLNAGSTRSPEFDDVKGLLYTEMNCR